MDTSLVMQAVVSGTALSALLLTGCDPICIDNLTPADRGHAYANDAGVCVVVMGAPGGDAGPEDAGDGDGGTGDGGTGDGGARDGGSDAGSDGGAGDAGPMDFWCAGPGWTTRLLDEGMGNAEMPFLFDAKGVGHFAYVKDTRIYVGSTNPGDVPRRIGEALSYQPLRMVRDSLGASHVLFTQNDWVYYTHDRSGAWELYPLLQGLPAALTFDAWGGLHVLMQQTLPQQGTIYVHGLRPGTAGWRTLPLPELGQVGELEQLAVDASDRLHILFLRREFLGSIPVYATNATGAWTVEPLDWEIPSGSGRPRFQLQLDARGRPHVLGVDAAGTWWWVKDGTQWQRQFMGPFQSHAPALYMGADGPSHALLQDREDKQFSRMSVWAVTPGMDGGSATPWLPLESSDGGVAVPVGGALHVDAHGVVRVGTPYVTYTPVDGGPDKVTRGLRYSRYCP